MMRKAILKEIEIGRALTRLSYEIRGCFNHLRIN